MKTEQLEDEITERATAHVHETTQSPITTLPPTTELITTTDPSTTTLRIVDATLAVDQVELGKLILNYTQSTSNDTFLKMLTFYDIAQLMRLWGKHGVYSTFSGLFTSSSA